MKKLNRLGFAHIIIPIVILVIVLGISGIAGYRLYSKQTPRAKAEGWSELAKINGAILFGCKVTYNSAYGQIYETKMIISNNSSHAFSANLTLTKGGGATISASPSSWSTFGTAAQSAATAQDGSKPRHTIIFTDTTDNSHKEIQGDTESLPSC